MKVIQRESDSDSDIVILNRMRHRPHRVGKEGYKPLKEIVGKEDYNKFRDSLRNIHSRFHNYYVDIKNFHYYHQIDYLQLEVYHV